MTLPEIRRLLLACADDPVRQRHRLIWSHFRRRHQAFAKQCHTLRRARPSCILGDPPMQTMTAALPLLTDEQWLPIVHLFPAEHSTGRQPLDHRCVLTGILWVNRTGAGWHHLPAASGPGTTVQRRYRRWREDGTWDAILAILREPEARPIS